MLSGAESGARATVTAAPGTTDPASRLVRQLEQLAHPGGREEEVDRAALAALRRGLGKSPGETAEMYPYVARHLDGVKPADEWAYYLVASLFAWHPPRATGGPGAEPQAASDDKQQAEPSERPARTWRPSLGASFARLGGQTPSDSPTRMMVALLNSHSDDLPERLRRSVGLLRSHDVPVDWTQLLRDLLAWQQPSRQVQRRWARDFWGSLDVERGEGGASESASTAPDEQGDDEA